MMPSEVNSLNANDSIYKSVSIDANKNQYYFLKVSGKINYVMLCKKNVPSSIGKEFKTFDQMQEAYKLPELKTMILLAESLLGN